MTLNAGQKHHHTSFFLGELFYYEICLCLSIAYCLKYRLLKNVPNAKMGRLKMEMAEEVEGGVEDRGNRGG